MCLLNPLSGRRIELPPFPFSDKEDHSYPFKVILSHSPDEQDCRALMIIGSMDRAAVFWEHKENLVGYQKTKDSTLCAADVHYLIGSPSVFCLRMLKLRTQAVFVISRLSLLNQ